MSVTAAANALILASVIAASIDNIDVISVVDAGGECFRKAYQSVDSISATERKYTFYLTEDEGNTDITEFRLYGNGATTALGNGTEMCTQILNIEKTNTQSLLVYWTVKVVQ
jgi:hypothetical protein